MTPLQRMRARAAMNARNIGPQVPGGRYLCGYWQQEYTVLAIASLTDDSTPVFTVQWADGRKGSHCTAWDARRDRVIAQP